MKNLTSHMNDDLGRMVLNPDVNFVLVGLWKNVLSVYSNDTSWTILKLKTKDV